MFVKPTLKQLVDRIEPDLSVRLTGNAKPLRRSAVRILAVVYAGAVYLLYGYLDWIAKQIFPDTADEENAVRWAGFFGINKKSATFNAGAVTFSGVNGTVLAAGTQVQRADGILYTIDADAPVSGGTVTVDITCSTAGADGDMEEGTPVSLFSPQAGITAGVVASGGVSGGADEETIPELRARLIKRLQEPPQGGADADYEQWALEVPGVTRAWPKPLYLGVGTVGVFFVRDNDANLIPDSGEVDDVQAYINARRPVTADVYVMAPTPVAINFTIHIVPDTAENRAAVQAELKDLILREAEPGGSIYLSHIREAISIAAGEVDHTLTVPSADVTRSPGQISVMGTITWA